MIGIVARLRAAGCVFAEDEAALIRAQAGSPVELDALVARRVAGEPLEHVLGWASFCGLRIAVEPGVFVPRRRTEFLARTAITRAVPGAVVLDLCCGSGALAAAVAAAVPGVEVHAADIEPAAVRCARRNLPGAQVHEGDLFEPLPPGLRGRVDVLVVNVPYVPTGEVALMPPEARDHEPRRALDGGGDGLEVLRRVAAEAGAWLAPGGAVLTEVSLRQVPEAVSVLTSAALEAHAVEDDDLAAHVAVGVRHRTSAQGGPALA